MKRLQLCSIVVLLGLFSATMISCSKENLVDLNQSALSSGGHDPAETMYQINIQGGKFDPAQLYALPAHKVTWKNRDAVVHTVVSDDGRTFNSGNINPGGSFVFITGETGEYPYHCGLHPAERGLLSVVTR